MNNKILALSTKIARKLKKNSPELLIAVGCIGVVSGTISACRATLKVADVKEHYDELLETVDNTLKRLPSEEYSSEDADSDKFIIGVQSTISYIRLYAPAAVLTLGGVAAFFGAYGILKKRNLGLMAAYAALDTAYKEYRERVVTEFGEEVDKRLHLGTKFETIDGKKTEVLNTSDNGELPWGSEYQRVFDESCPQWTKSPEYNKAFLIGQQNFANEKLKVNGHVFLNEVYDALGFERTQAGSVVGWMKDGNGDGFIDFGIFDPVYVQHNGAFINGFERSIWLDFNVDGVIWNKI